MRNLALEVDSIQTCNTKFTNGTGITVCIQHKYQLFSIPTLDINWLNPAARTSLADKEYYVLPTRNLLHKDQHQLEVKGWKKHEHVNHKWAFALNTDHTDIHTMSFDLLGQLDFNHGNFSTLLSLTNQAKPQRYNTVEAYNQANGLSIPLNHTMHILITISTAF